MRMPFGIKPVGEAYPYYATSALRIGSCTQGNVRRILVLSGVEKAGLKEGRKIYSSLAASKADRMD